MVWYGNNSLSESEFNHAFFSSGNIMDFSVCFSLSPLPFFFFLYIYMKRFANWSAIAEIIESDSNERRQSDFSLSFVRGNVRRLIERVNGSENRVPTRSAVMIIPSAGGIWLDTNSFPGWKAMSVIGIASGPSRKSHSFFSLSLSRAHLCAVDSFSLNAADIWFSVCDNEFSAIRGMRRMLIIMHICKTKWSRELRAYTVAVHCNNLMIPKDFSI